MVRLLHTADWQIGLKARHVAEAASEVRKARMDAAQAVIREANAARVDAVVLAGDTFEDNLVDDTLMREVIDILAASVAPVYVLPGNHDALTHDSVFRRRGFAERPKHVVLLDRSEPLPIPGTDAILLPAPVRQKKSFGDPTATLPVVPDGAIAIGVAHGSLRIEGRYAPDDFPIALDAATRAGLDYLALGHWHGHYVQGERIAYSGTHETTSFGEERSGQALLVEIPSRGAAPSISAVRTGQLRWLTLELDLGRDASTNLARIDEALGDGQANMVRARTTGLAGDDGDEVLARLLDRIRPKARHVIVDRRHTRASDARGRMAELASSSALVAGLVLDVSDPSEDACAAREILRELAMEVWR